jgi:hypothetical protein
VGHTDYQESEKIVNAFKLAQNNNVKDVQMERTKEEVTATTKLVTETVDRGKMGKYNCVGIAARASTNQEISAQPVARNFKKCGKPNHFATVCRSEPSSKGPAAATSNSGPVAGRVYCGASKHRQSMMPRSSS